MTAPRFSPGDRVRLRANPARVGRIDRAAIPFGPTWSYDVFFGGNDVQGVNEGDLELAPSPRLQVLPRDAFLRALLLAKLSNPLTDLLYAYQASRTQAEAYQFKPVLKFLDAPVPGILIADEVGLGKTIEAAILYQELAARSPMRRVLVVCPAGLRDKWQMELSTRFDEHFQIFRGADVAKDLRLYRETSGAQPLKAIVALETIRARRLQALFDEFQVSYDLVIVDEAHHLRTAGRLSNQIGERLSDLSDNIVLLTATPLQTGRIDLFNTLRFLDPSQFTSMSDFEVQLAPNTLLNAAIRALRGMRPDWDAARKALEAIPMLPAGTQVTAHPNYPSVVQRLAPGHPATDREAVVRLQRDLDQMNVISSIYTRTRKADVSGVAKRKAFVIPVLLTDAEAELYAAVFAHARAEAAERSKTGMVAGWAGMMRERQAASCIAATRLYYDKHYGTAHDDLLIEESTVDVVHEDDGHGRQQRPSAGAALARVQTASAALGQTDSKLATFIRTMREALPEASGGKAIVFSFFRRTLAHLERELKQHGFDVVVIHGDVKPEDRARVIEEFRSNPKIQIMLASEVGAEGLDFQFCDTLVNYDLPWNPMKVEQRIGRIDRYGQKRPTIRIYSFVLEDTIEQRILARLYTRIGIFEDSIGDLEPILGPAVAELTREVFSADLTPAEEAEVLERHLQMVINRREQDRQLERRTAELLGQDALLMQRISDSVTSGRYVSVSELRAVVDGYLESLRGGAQLVDHVGDGQTVTLYGDGALANAIQGHLQAQHDTRPMATEFLGKLYRSGQVPGTFDGEVAHEKRRIEFFNLRHPLIRVAVEHFRRARGDTAFPLVSLRVDPAALPAADGGWPGSGSYQFVLYLLGLGGVRRQTRLAAIAFDETGRRAPCVEGLLLRLVQDFATDEPHDDWTRDERETLQAQARLAVSGEADRLQAEAQERNDGWLAVRRATLERTFRAKLEKRRLLLARSEDERIVRMRTAEITNLQSELQRRLAELDRQREVTAEFSPIGMGRIRVLGERTEIETGSGRADQIAINHAPAPASDEEMGGFPEPPPVFHG